MRTFAVLITFSLAAGIVAAVGCGNSATTTTTGGGGATSSSSSSNHAGPTSTTATTGVTTGVGGSGGGTGGSMPSPVECTLPATPPSAGSCVAFTPGDAGELDAGVDMNGVASTTTCNPVTNAGCTGTDWCGPDSMNTNFYCQAAGTPAGILACGDCTASAATCGPGGLCVGFTADTYTCINMCCTDADCGAGKCDTTVLATALPSGVGLCVIQ